MRGRTLSLGPFAAIFLSMVAQLQFLRANPLSPPSGSYELTARLELPHLERWGVDKTTIICLFHSQNHPDANAGMKRLVAQAQVGPAGADQGLDLGQDETVRDRRRDGD